VLLVGLGDSFASLAGMYLGRIKWPHTKKTVEGTMAAVAVVLLAGLLLSLCYPFVSLSLGQVRTTTPLHPFLLVEEFVAHMSLPRLISLVWWWLAVARLRVGGGVWLPVGGLHHADRQPSASALRLRRAVLLTRRVSASQRQKRSTPSWLRSALESQHNFILNYLWPAWQHLDLLPLASSCLHHVRNAGEVVHTN
jgi:hypothetical protein